MDLTRRNVISQWAFDTRPILGRFHLWLDDVEERWIQGGPEVGEALSFTGTGLEKCFIMTAAVTALGTRLFGRFGEGKELDKAGINRIKKDADAVSAYAMSESLWYLTRSLPENHAVMVSLGEGLMPKAGETPEMGSNPLLGFGRVYARPQVARFIDRQVHSLLNERGFEWTDFWQVLQTAGITVWGAAIDTLENTTRFATGSPTGPMTVLHLFDQPLEVARPYEGYMGMLVLPRRVVDEAEERSVAVSYLSPRKVVLDSILTTYPELSAERVHVWTLGGPSREPRIGGLWEEWRALGVHLVEDGWPTPTGMGSFIDSGTYAPAFCVGTYTDDDGELNLFLIDGYAASAEAIQGASLDPILDTYTSLCIFSSQFKVPYDRERFIMDLDPRAEDFPARLEEILGAEPTSEQVEMYRGILVNAEEAGLPLHRRTVTVDDFFPEKRWRVLAIGSYMLPDPYTGADGVEQVAPGVYRVVTHASTRKGILEVSLTLRLMESFEESRLVFSPLLDRFYRGTDFRTRAVKISDSGRIRNELQTLASEALEHFGEDGIRIHFDQIDDAVLPPDKKELIREVLEWYKQTHPIWFQWLEIR